MHSTERRAQGNVSELLENSSPALTFHQMDRTQMATSALEFVPAAPKGREGDAGLALKPWEDGATWTL